MKYEERASIIVIKTGIYKIQNLINGKCYIGQARNIKSRWAEHKKTSQNPNDIAYNYHLYRSIRKYGLENFDFEIVAELTQEEYTKETLDNLEKFFINFYDSFKNGYNATEGGDDNPNRAQLGSKNGRALLDEEEVKYIRECYNAHIPFRKVYEEFQDRISKRGLQKIWWFDTWKHIYPEYKTAENKYWHSH